MRKIGISDFPTKPTNLYNLDVIISVGYRVKSKRGTQFRIWAYKVLKEYLIKSFAMDDECLKGRGGGDYWKELFERIKTSARPRNTCIARCSTSMRPPSTMIQRRKNYLSETELKVLNNLVSGYFDFAEISAIEHKPMRMVDYIEQLDKILSTGGRELLLDGPGKITHEKAAKIAKKKSK